MLSGPDKLRVHASNSSGTLVCREAIHTISLRISPYPCLPNSYSRTRCAMFVVSITSLFR